MFVDFMLSLGLIVGGLGGGVTIGLWLIDVTIERNDTCDERL